MPVYCVKNSGTELVLVAKIQVTLIQSIIYQLSALTISISSGNGFRIRKITILKCDETF